MKVSHDEQREKDLRAYYDSDGDVLYVSVGEPMSAVVDDDEGGVLLRRSDTGPCGVTVIGYAEGGWSDKTDTLLERMSNHLRVNSDALRTIIENALNRRSE